jgi:ABC-type transporter Mla subunit MlaD
MLILVAVTATGFVLQGIALFLIARRIGLVTTRVQKLTDDLERRANHLISQAGSLLESLRPLGRVSQTVSNNISEIVEIARLRAKKLDSFVQEITETVKVQATKLDYVVTDTVQKFEETTASIQRDVLVPAMEISSFIKAVRSGFDYLFSRRRDRMDARSAEDEEMFI